MKRLILLAVLFFGFSAMAQEKPIISSAVIAIDRNNDVQSAKGYIDEAQNVVSTKALSEIREKDLSKFYYYKGLINYRVANSSDESIKALDPNALDKAVEGFSQLLEFEKKTGKKRYSDEANKQMTVLSNDIARRGIAASGAGDYESAYNDFLKSYTLKKDIANTVDTNMYYNAALMAQQNKTYEKAIPIYEDLVKMDYHGTRFFGINIETGDTMDFSSGPQMKTFVEAGKIREAQTSGDVRPNLYTTLIYLTLEEGDTASYKKYLSEGRTKFPNNVDILKAELQLFFDNKEYDKALANLDQAIAADPKNAVMYYNKGVILQTEMKRTAAALAAYQKTLEVDPNYTDALYMSSIIYIDSANAIGDQMNELPLNAKTKYKALEEKQKEVFTVSLPYLEQAYNNNKEDEQVKGALTQVYRALKMYDKAKALMD
ncbi:MAG: tetratricopeptide repeat protein [Croceimicrobium sp.]